MAEQLVAERRLMFDESFYFGEIHLAFGDRTQQPQIRTLVCWNMADLQILRVTEEIALKAGKADFCCGQKVLAGFHLVRQHAAGLAGIAAHQRSALRGRHSCNVDLNVVGVRDQRFPPVAGHEIV
jgi:hypothetical protein